MRRHERLRPSLPLVTRGAIQLLFSPLCSPVTNPFHATLKPLSPTHTFHRYGASRALSTKKVQPFRWSRHLYSPSYSRARIRGEPQHAFSRPEGRIPASRGRFRFNQPRSHANLLRPLSSARLRPFRGQTEYIDYIDLSLFSHYRLSILQNSRINRE